MRFLKSEIDADAGAVVSVQLDHAANVMLLDGINFNRYRRGESFRYVGGLYNRSPVRLPVPHAGHWYVVIDLGGRAGHVRAAVSVL